MHNLFKKKKSNSKNHGHHHHSCRTSGTASNHSIRSSRITSNSIHLMNGSSLSTLISGANSSSSRMDVIQNRRQNDDTAKASGKHFSNSLSSVTDSLPYSKY